MEFYLFLKSRQKGASAFPKSEFINTYSIGKITEPYFEFLINFWGQNWSSTLNWLSWIVKNQNFKNHQQTKKNPFKILFGQWITSFFFIWKFNPLKWRRLWKTLCIVGFKNICWTSKNTLERKLLLWQYAQWTQFCEFYDWIHKKTQKMLR